MFRTLIYPSSGACDCAAGLQHWLFRSRFGVRWRFGVVGLEAEAQPVVLQLPACNTDTTPTQPHRTKYETTNVIIQQHSRKLLMMDILMSKTCWAHKKWNKIASDIKLVFFNYHNDARSNAHKIPSETLILLVWNYLVFGNISESNVSCHLSKLKAVCSCLQLEKVRHPGPNLYTTIPVNWSRIEKGWLNCEYCRMQFCGVNVPPAGMPKKNSTFWCLKTRPSSRLEMSRNIYPIPRRTDTSGIVCTVQLLTVGRGTCSDNHVACTARIRRCERPSIWDAAV